MIALMVIVVALATFGAGYALGIRLSQSHTTRNHLSMVRLLDRVVEQDSHLPTLPPGERETAQALLEDFWKRPPEITR